MSSFVAAVVTTVGAAAGGGIIGAALGAAAGGAIIGGGVAAVTGGSVLDGALNGAVTGAITGGIAGGVGGAIGAASSLDAAGQVTANALAEQGAMSATQAANLVGQVGNEAAASMSAALADGSITAADVQALSANLPAIAAGGSAASIPGLSSQGQNFLAQTAGKQLLGALGTGLGAAYQANQTQGGYGTIAQANTTAANILAPAALQAGQIQSTAAKTATDQAVAGQTAALGTVGATLDAQKQLYAPGVTAADTALANLTKGLSTPFTMANAQNMDAYKFAAQAGFNAMGPSGGTLNSNEVNSQMGIASQFENQAYQQYLQNLQAQESALGATTPYVNATGAATGTAGANTENLQQQIGSTQAAGTTAGSNATANAVTGAAQAQAQGVLGAGGASGTGQIAAGNIISGGINSVGNQLSKIGSVAPMASGNPSSVINTGGTTVTAPATSSSTVPMSSYNPNPVDTSGTASPPLDMSTLQASDTGIGSLPSSVLTPQAAFGG